MRKRSRRSSARIREKFDTGTKHDDLREDWINRLPDDILVEIVCRLSLTEAARTSVLSARWRNLWTYSTKLNFNDPRMLWKFSRDYSSDEKLAKRSKYISWVNKVLELHRGSNIYEFGIYYELYDSHGSAITNWILTAISKGVQKLVLNLRGAWSNKKYTFPQEFYKSLRHPQGLSQVKSLKSLSLTDVNATQEILEFFIYNCPLLERLHVANIDSPHLLGLKVVGSSIRLKYLEIYCCFSIKEVEVSAPCLLSFKFHGPEIKLHVENVPQLLDVTIGGHPTAQLRNHIEPIRKYLPQLETLELYLHLSMDSTELPFCELPKLRHLTFKVFAPDSKNLLALTYMIKACPILQKFTLKFVLTGRSRTRKIRQFPKCPHHHLKVVELIGFVGRPIDLELAFHLLENAMVLEKMIINPSSPFALGSDLEIKDCDKKEAARMSARQLEEKVPEGVEFVIC